ncbi:MAG: toll/interleukin-1 receptor domain-containing protein [Ruminococcus sp.]|uniref:toll/interleukin-1 receptor domain-containing protein n=1 Tax=Ruminococcus sp. TaxID=41978 RepID=UPI002873716D|nr:toll/interleukin-1 receptor domain-containing protein [Ruminococcus sp.]MBQ3284858.1 toll/interleukin-1 receptor domain-containing protein [Ruminococcus sp.]
MDNQSQSTLIPGAGNTPCPAYRGQEPYIYICYSHSDSRMAFDEIRRIQEAGYLVCYDEGISPGNSFPKEIASDIRNSALFVVLITPRSIKDKYVNDQIQCAMFMHIPVLSIYPEGTEMPPELGLLIGSAPAIMKDHISDAEYEYRLFSLLKRLGNHTCAKEPPKCGSAASSGYVYPKDNSPCYPLPNCKGNRPYGRGSHGENYPKDDSRYTTTRKEDDPPIPLSPKKKPGFFSSLFSRKSKTVEAPPVTLSDVQFSAVAPESLKRSEYTIIDVMMYEEEFRYTVDELITQSDIKMKETKSGVLKVKHASEIGVVLSSPDIEIDDNRQLQKWSGSYLRFQFAVMLPDNYVKKQVLFNADIYINDIIATKLKFTLLIEANSKQKPDLIRTDILSAFVSYSSEDRKRVAAIIQGMSKARPDLDIFFDIESLRSGDDWEKVLTQEIDKRDMLFLCWSKNASKSTWVDFEWRYVYNHKGIERIEPIPLESPEKCPPPKELSAKHFNDKLLYIINSSAL